jgi:hypothetical protein
MELLMNALSRKSLISFAGAAILMLSAAVTQANTLSVPSQYRTIQSAINAAHAGDTIVVAAGTYQEILTWNNKDLSIHGAGAGKSIIDGADLDRCLATSGLTTASSISGFTFYRGGDAGGGGIANTGSKLIVTGCAFSYNSGGWGAAMFNDAGSNVTVTNCSFDHNGAANGGAIVNQYSHSTVSNCTFNTNYAALGGAIYNYLYSSSTVANCIFFDNSANGDGAAGGGGGAIYNDMYCQATATNCTFSGNFASYGYGGALYNSGYNAVSSLVVTNCILWDDTAELGSPEIYGNAGVSYSDVQGLANTVPDANHNFGANPLFVNPTSENLNLKAGSPCIDRGVNSVLASPPFLAVSGGLIDMNGCRRLSGSAVDLGAYEFQSVADVSSIIKIASNPPTPSNGAIYQILVLTNNSGLYLNGPVTLVLNGLKGYVLANGSGVTSALTPAGRQYFTVASSLSPWQSVRVALQFVKTGAGTITYTPQVYDGIGKR